MDLAILWDDELLWEEKKKEEPAGSLVRVRNRAFGGLTLEKSRYLKKLERLHIMKVIVCHDWRR